MNRIHVCILAAAACALSLALQARPSSAVANIERTGAGLLVSDSAAVLKIEPVTAGIICVTRHPAQPPSAGQPAAPSLSVIATAAPGLEWSLDESGNALVTSLLKVAVNPGTGALSFFDSKGNILLREPDSGAYSFADAQATSGTWFYATQTFVSSPGEALYGLGQFQDGVMNRAGTGLLLSQANMQVAVPVLVSSAGYGILWDNPSVTSFSARDGKIVFGSEYAQVLVWYFVYGPEPDTIVAGVRELTGAAPLPPRWSFGYMQSKERYKTQDEVLSVVKEYRDRKLPLDLIIQDWQYWGKYGWSAMKFDEDVFPDPKAMIDELHNKYNAHIMISIWPKFDPSSEIYKAMDAKGYLYDSFGEGGARTYDAFSPEARKIYWDYADKGIFSKGMDAWWMDATEPEIASARTQELASKYIREAGNTVLGPFVHFHNAYPLMTTQGMYENQRAATSDKRVLILTRSAFTGQQRNAAATWSGDIEGEWGVLRKQIPAGLNFNFAGIPYWTTDIGGFFVRYHGGCLNDEYKELYVRWFQFGAFCPLFRSHGTHTPREIWQFGEKGTWAYDALEKYDRLRYRLLPYIYSLAWKVTSENYTMMRGLAFDFRNDPAALGVGDQFMFGPAFLVNPVTEPMYHREKLNAMMKKLKEVQADVQAPIVVNTVTRSRSVYLPQSAGWYDFWTGQRYDGGQTIESPAPVDIMPLFVRAGSIVPMGPHLQWAAEKPADPIEIRVYPGASAEFTIYEDEGDNYNYEKGAHAEIPISWNNSSRVLTIGDRTGSFPGMLASRTFNIVLAGPGRGAGLEPEPKPDATVIYSGKKVSTTLR